MTLCSESFVILDASNAGSLGQHSIASSGSMVMIERRDNGAQGWHFWSIGGDSSVTSSHQHESKVPTLQPITAVATLLTPTPQTPLEMSVPTSNDGTMMKKEGWQFWALGDATTEKDQPATLAVSATPSNEKEETTQIVKSAHTAAKKGWQYWAIGVANKSDDQSPDDAMLSENLNVDKPALALRMRGVGEEESRDECAWRYWSRMQNREEPRTSAKFDSTEAWQFWAIGVTDTAFDDQVSLLTEGFEIDSPMMNVVKIKTLKRIEPIDESGWRYWSRMKTNAAALKATSANDDITKQGWQFWSIGAANQASMDQQHIVSESFDIEPPLVKSVARIPIESRDEIGWRYWSRVKTEDAALTASNVASKQGWQFWALGGANSATSTYQKQLLSASTKNESPVVKSTIRQQGELQDEIGWRYWSQMEAEGGALTSSNAGTKQGWQFWALGVSNHISNDRPSSLSSEATLEVPVTEAKSGDAAEEGGWRYWSRMNGDNHEDLLQRDDLTFSFPYPTDHYRATTAMFTADAKFYPFQTEKTLTRIEEENASRDTPSLDEVFPIEDDEDSADESPPELDQSMVGTALQQDECVAPERIDLTNASEDGEDDPSETNEESKREILKDASAVIKQFKKSLPSFEKHGEKVFSLDKLRPARVKDSQTKAQSAVTPARGRLPSDWIDKRSTPRRNRNLLSEKEKVVAEQRYQEEASRLFAQAESRKRSAAQQHLLEEQERLKQDLEETGAWHFEDFLLRGIALTATNAVDAIQYAFSGSFRKKKDRHTTTEDDDEKGIEFFSKRIFSKPSR